MSKFKNILGIINARKKLNCIVDIIMSKDDIFKVCEIHHRDKMFDHDIGYISNWLKSYLRYHIPDIKVLLYGDFVYITDRMNVIYDNIHTKYPSGNMHKHKFDFRIKRLTDIDFVNYKNCGISNTIIPECGVYIIRANEGEYIGTSTNICNRLRQCISLLNSQDQILKKKIRSPIKLITIFECSDIGRARYLEKELSKKNYRLG